MNIHINNTKAKPCRYMGDKPRSFLMDEESRHNYDLIDWGHNKPIITHGNQWDTIKDIPLRAEGQDHSNLSTKEPDEQDKAVIALRKKGIGVMRRDMLVRY